MTPFSRISGQNWCSTHAFPGLAIVNLSWKMDQYVGFTSSRVIWKICRIRKNGSPQSCSVIDHFSFIVCYFPGEREVWGGGTISLRFRPVLSPVSICCPSFWRDDSQTSLRFLESSGIHSEGDWCPVSENKRNWWKYSALEFVSFVCSFLKINFSLSKTPQWLSKAMISIYCLFKRLRWKSKTEINEFVCVWIAWWTNWKGNM